MPLITIDGETAKDFDDAVYAESRRGGWRLVVAIADVAHYVKTGSALDAEARERGTSVYLPNFVHPPAGEADWVPCSALAVAYEGRSPGSDHPGYTARGYWSRGHRSRMNSTRANLDHAR